jgi:FkbM family methyltransferase
LVKAEVTIRMSTFAHSPTYLTRLIGLYRVAVRSGLMECPWFQYIFQHSYFQYKMRLEDPFLEFGRRHPQFFHNGHILDIGANIGYTPWVFARFLSRGYKVFAFEPDEKNFLQLEAVLRRYQLEEKVVALRKAVGKASGTASLWVNKAHHGDHRIVTSTFRSLLPDDQKTCMVDLVSVDDFARGEGIESNIAFIKIDVQGFETAVCEGMEETIRENPDLCVAFEYAPEQMHELGFAGGDLLDYFVERGFRLYVLDMRGRLEALHLSSAGKLAAKSGHFDAVALKGRFAGVP